MDVCYGTAEEGTFEEEFWDWRVFLLEEGDVGVSFLMVGKPGFVF